MLVTSQRLDEVERLADDHPQVLQRRIGGHVLDVRVDGAEAPWRSRRRRSPIATWNARIDSSRTRVFAPTAGGLATVVDAAHRFRSLPMAHTAVLVGRTTTDLIRNGIALTVMLAAGYAPVLLFVYLSSAWVPIDTMHSAVRGFARYQPVNVTIESVRALANGTSATSQTIQSIAWSLALTAVFAIVATRQFRKALL